MVDPGLFLTIQTNFLPPVVDILDILSDHRKVATLPKKFHLYKKKENTFILAKKRYWLSSIKSNNRNFRVLSKLKIYEAVSVITLFVSVCMSIFDPNNFSIKLYFIHL